MQKPPHPSPFQPQVPPHSNPAPALHLQFIPQDRDPHSPHSLRSLEVWPWGQIQVLALRHEQAVQLDGDGMRGAVQALDGDAEGHQVHQGVVGVELVGGRVASGLNCVAEGPCKHSLSHQPLETLGFSPLRYLLVPTGQGIAFPRSRCSFGLDDTAESGPGQAADGLCHPTFDQAP